jgi:hypothetical protein
VIIKNAKGKPRKINDGGILNRLDMSLLSRWCDSSDQSITLAI